MTSVGLNHFSIISEPLPVTRHWIIEDVELIFVVNTNYLYTIAVNAEKFINQILELFICEIMDK